MFLQVQDTSASPTLSRLLTAGMNRGSSIKSDRSSNSLELPSNTVGVDSLCAEMNNLMHEFEVVSRIADLVSTLKGSYKVCCEANFKTLGNNLLLCNIKAIPVQAWTGQEGSRRLRLPDFQRVST